ncbi:putative quinol monooxygenase [Vibrio sp. EA2]|uniref:putative quinol monooxygenase n=1 Tax=Vibrio sp. EA2 TaxID=3079860 RepID=UPI0029490A8A|nr:antibiotic biosynthesis monooxygenase [Vibrio sp. EA2]MDV6253555.1 antibiotic biosynthesis monooxygenase [Vibrio sp. EA2]
MQNTKKKLSITAEILIKDEMDLATGIEEIMQFCLDMNSEPGCEIAVVHQDRENPRKIVLWEIYKDEDAFADHFKAPHTQAFFSREITELKWASETSPLSELTAE